MVETMTRLTKKAAGIVEPTGDVLGRERGIGADLSVAASDCRGSGIGSFRTTILSRPSSFRIDILFSPSSIGGIKSDLTLEALDWAHPSY